MKQLFLCLIATMITSLLWAQTVTLQFIGVNKNRNYQVVIDGTTYNSAEAVGSGKNKMVTMTNLSTGSHSLALYPAGSAVSDKNALYSNTFQLREGYDMNIIVGANGAVSFTETKNNQTAISSGSYNAAMAMGAEDYSRLARSVRSKLLQASRVSALRTAFNNTSTFFTTNQVAQLLSYVSSEPMRLELAKAAYTRVIDSANYRNLNELFSNESLRSELDFFLRNTTITPGATTNANTSNTANHTDTGVANKPSTTSGSGGGTTKSEVVTTPDNNASASRTTRADKRSGVDQSSTRYEGRTPVANRSFNQLSRRVRNQRVQQGKVAVLKDAFEGGDRYFTTAQLRQLLLPITAEADRLVLAKLAYPRTADTANFKSLYDLFQDRYNQLELDHFIRFGSVGTTVTTDAVDPRYAHRVAISETDYANLDLKVRFHLRQASTITDIRKAFTSNHYFTAEQIRQWLNLVASETDRLALAKLAYLRITNPATFASLYDLFQNQESKDELDRYIAANKY